MPCTLYSAHHALSTPRKVEELVAERHVEKLIVVTFLVLLRKSEELVVVADLVPWLAEMLIAEVHPLGGCDL